MTESMSMTEITKELREMATYDCGSEAQSETVVDAADLIETQAAEIARLDEELGRCTSGNGTYISLESHNKILAKQNADLLQKTQRLTEQLGAAVGLIDEIRNDATADWDDIMFKIDKWRGEESE